MSINTDSWPAKPQGELDSLFRSFSTSTCNRWRKERRKKTNRNKTRVRPQTKKELSVRLWSSTESNLFIKWLESIVHHNEDLTRSFIFLCMFFQHVLDNKGPGLTVKMIKEIRLILMNYLNGVAPPQLSYNSLTFDNLPSHFRSLNRFVRLKDINDLRSILSFLSYSRLLIRESWGTYEGLDTIKTLSSPLPYISPLNLQKFTGEIQGLLPVNDRKLLMIQPTFSDFHITGKNGPTGVNALFSSFWDIDNIPESLKESIYTVGGPLLQERMEQTELNKEDLRLIVSKLLTSTELRKVSSSSDFRTIVRFGDPENKLRVIAIGDYWSQTALKPLNDLVFNILKYIPQDQTFDQGKGLLDLSTNVSINNTFYCYDLVSFTDTFPFELVLEWLGFVFGTKFSNSVKDIMVGYSFKVQGTSEYVQYGTGNPMGFYGSFALTSLMHHFVIYESCVELGISWSKAKYKLLGDDILIYDDMLANTYCQKLHTLNVKISPSKTLIGSNLFEFAKRVFFNGHEISPISYKSWLMSTQSIHEIVNLLNSSYLRGLNRPSDSGFIYHIIQTYKILQGKDRPKDERYIENLIKFELHCLTSKQPNFNVDRIISSALAPRGYLLNLNIMDNKECRDILLMIYYIIIKETMKDSVKTWETKDGGYCCDLYTFLLKAGGSEIQPILVKLGSIINYTPLFSAFIQLSLSVGKTIQFLLSNPSDLNNISYYCNWNDSNLRAEDWIKRRTSASLRKDSERLYFKDHLRMSKFAKRIRKLIIQNVDLEIIQHLNNSLPPVVYNDCTKQVQMARNESS